MTGKSKRKGDALLLLADALVDDIFNTSDEEILAEVSEEGEDPDKIAEDMRALFERTVMEQGKRKLAAARSAVEGAKRSKGVVVNLNVDRHRKRYEELISKDPDLSSKLTIAARKGQGQSNQDVQSAIEDLAELGLLDDEENDS